MRQEPFLASGVEEVVERLARLEEQMRHVATAVEKLANRDAELDASLRAISEHFNASLTSQREMFQASLKEVTESFVSREDWLFWKNLLMAAFIGLIVFGWNSLIGVVHR
jgi:predicted nuclease with TOPRIM domain